MKNKVAFLLVCAATVAMGIVAFFGIGPYQMLGVGNIRLGLDLQGGVTILYEADGPTPSIEDMNAANSLLRRRLDQRGYTEATTGREGTRQLRVNIPGVSDPERAVEEIGRTAQLTFRDSDGNVLLTGADVSRAQSGVDTGSPGAGQIVVNLEFTSQGTRLFEEATRNNIGRPLYIFMDDEFISAPIVNNVIPDGRAFISGGGLGGFTRPEADELANTIQSGSLPFRLTVVSMNSIGAQLGADALESSIVAGIIGIILVIISLFVVYRVSGLAANIALLLYAGIMLVIISLFQVTLTLPGIAGIILSVGMAVDANVIIFERLREEISTGRTMRSALGTGYKRAFPAIVDCNITTLIAAGALFWQGTGPIQGFALTLGLGIIISMFTSLVITKLLLTGLLEMGLRNPKWYGVPDPEKADKFEPFQLRVVENRNRFFLLSALVLLLGIGASVFNFANGNGFFNLDVEFAGGTSFQIDIGQPFTNEEIADIVREVTGQPTPQIQPILNENRVMIRIHSIEAEMRTELIDVISQRYGLTAQAFTYSDVSPTVSADMQRAAVWAVAIACLAMLVYITFRFKDARMGASTVITLLHDAFVTIAVFAILRIPLSYSFIAVLLTVIGYTINATIVIFDRIRENKAITRMNLTELINVSVSQSLRRSIITSTTTLMAIFSMFILGVPSIRDFTLPIMIGLVFGTYSSVFLSGSVWYMLSRGKEKRPAR